MHYMHGRANANDRAALRMYHARFPDRPMPDHRIFQRLHRQLREQARSTSPDMMLIDEEQQLVQALSLADYHLRLPVDGTAMCTAAGFHSSCAEQLL
ncbi:hypothetical protein TNCV_3249431 [Trichonephila clavipes]|nr:hypothetical protein TNCV_3249431 [Trichonephila clavipes]